MAFSRLSRSTDRSFAPRPSQLRARLRRRRRTSSKRLEFESLEPRQLLAADFGDAPAPYPTLAGDGGASHADSGPTLGAHRDAEPDGVPSALANGDDLAGTDDENGVQFGEALVAGRSTTVTVVVGGSGDARLDAWIDFNQDGSWDAGEQIADSVLVNPGANPLAFSVPDGAAVGQTYARFRLSTAGNLAPTGPAADGEVEDYHVTVSAPGVGVGADAGTLDRIHYIPPLYARDTLRLGEDINVHFLTLSTPITDPFNVTIQNAAGTVSETVTISKAAPLILNLSQAPFGGSLHDALGIVADDELNQVNTTDGIILTAPDRFYASLRHTSGSQGTSLTAKGQAGFGTEFRSGHLNAFLGATDSDHNRAHLISVMATEDNTSVTFNLPPELLFADGPNTFPGTVQTVTLDQGESYVIGMRVDDNDRSLLNELNGTLVTSDKPIVMNSGSWLAGNGGGRDIGTDQLLPADLIGDEYILARGNATTLNDILETPIVVAHYNNTQIFLNGATTPVATIDAGDYYIIPGSQYAPSDTMLIRTSEPSYIYQTTAGANSTANVGMNFAVAISDALQPQEVVIPQVDQIGAAILNIVAPSGAPVTFNGVTLSGAQPVDGTTDFEIYRLTTSPIDGNPLSGNVSIDSPEPLFISFTTASGVRTTAAYFSGVPNSVAIDDRVITAFETPITIDVLDNDLTSETGTSITAVTDPPNGSVVLNPDGTITYTPDNNFNGEDTFDYTVNDAPAGVIDTGTVVVKVVPNTFTFELSAGSYSVLEGDAPQTTNVVKVQRFGDITISAAVDVNLFAGAGNPATPGVDFTPGPIPISFAPGETVKNVPIEILGELLIEPDEKISLSVTGPDIEEPPTASFTIVTDEFAVDDTDATDEDTVLNVGGLGLLENDFRSGPNHQVVAVNGGAALVGTPVTLASGAIVTVQSDGSYSYDPNGAHVTLNPGDTALDSFTYSTSDGRGNTDSAAVEIIVTGVHHLPVTVDDFASTSADQAFDSTTVSPDTLDIVAGETSVLANDSDADIDGVLPDQTLHVADYDAVSTMGAVVQMQADGRFRYDPTSAPELLALRDGQTASDSFTYWVADNSDTFEPLMNVEVYTGTNASLGSADAARANDVPAATGTVELLDIYNSGLTGHFEVNHPVPGLPDPTDYYSVFVTGVLRVTTPGVYTFGSYTDDNSRLRIDLNQNGDLTDDATVLLQSGCCTDIIGAPLTLDAGTYAFEAVYSEGWGASYGEFFYAPGAKTSFDDDFRLLGDGSQGILAGRGNFSRAAATVTVNVAGVEDAPLAHDDGIFRTTEDSVFSLSAGTGGKDNYAAIVQSLAPVAFWDFNEGSGTLALDRAGDDNPGVIRGATYTPSGDGFSGEAGDHALSFDGNDVVSVDVTTFGGTIDDNNEVTFSLWQYGIDQPRNDYLFHAPGTSTRQALVHLPWSDSRVYWDTGGCCSANERVSTFVDPSLYNGSWNHWTFVKSGDVKEIYVNGSLLLTGINTTPLEDFTQLFIGAAWGGGGSGYLGKIDDFAIFDDALTASQIAQLYAAGATGVGLLTNDSDPDAGDSISVVGAAAVGPPPLGLTPITLSTSHGASVVVQADGSFQYDPTVSASLNALNSDGSVTDSFSYLIEDETGQSDTATVTVEVRGVNDAPLAVNDTASTAADQPLTGAASLLNNDSDVDGGVVPGLVSTGVFTGGDVGEGLDLDGNFLYAVNVRGPAAGPVRDAVFTDDQVAGVTVSANREHLYWGTPEYGSTANDNNLETVMRSIRWSWFSEIAVSLDNLVVGQQYKLQLLTREQCCDRGFDIFAEGVKILDDFSPGSVQGGSGRTDQGAVVTYEFIAGDSTLDIRLDRPANFPDTNPILQGLTLEQLGAPAGPLPELYVSNVGDRVAGTLVPLASGATVVARPDGSYTYDPKGAFDYLAAGETATDSFTYSASDGSGTGTATVSVTVQGVNEAPQISDASFSIPENTANGTTLGTVSASDGDASDTLSFSILAASNPGGAFAIDGSGTISVGNQAVLDFETTPSFALEVQVSDGNGGSDTATVVVLLSDLQATASITDVSAAEGDSGATGFDFAISLSGDVVNVPFTIGYASADGTALASDGDYAAAAGDLAFAGTVPGESRVATINVLGDDKAEPNETFVVNLLAVSSNDISLVDSQGLGTILNEDFAPVADAGGPYTLVEGGSLTLDASATTDADSTSLTYRWDVDGDGDFDENVTGATPTLTESQLASLGIEDITGVSRPIFLHVSDGTNSDTEQTTLLVVNRVDVSGRVFNDLDNDGRYDAGDGDSGLGGVRIEVWDSALTTLIASTTTAADGTYTVDSDLGPGSYKIVEAVDELADFDLLDGKETAGNLGGGVDNTQDSNVIDLTIEDTGTAADAVDYLFAEMEGSDVFGSVWRDFNDDGEVNFGESGIAGVPLQLTGVDDRGANVSRSAVSGTDGSYAFIDLRPGTYALTETQPAGFADGRESLGEVTDPGVPTATSDSGYIDGNDRFAGLQLVPGSVGDRYNFGEQPEAGGPVGDSVTATIGFWHNRNGEALIESLNGGPSATQLGNWLAASFPHMYGAGAVYQGANGDVQDMNLAGKTNAEIADIFQFLHRRNAVSAVVGGPPKMDAQVLGTALAVYATSETLAGGNYAASYGFNTSADGIAYQTFNVLNELTTQEADDLGLSSHMDATGNVTLLAILQATDRLAADGLLYDTDGDDAIDSLELRLRTLANDLYTAINESSGI